MGHAHHFLSRLDRVSLPHVELALSLYRDEGLLRFILERARVPEGSERVALSLDHPEQGPFLVVTRDGRFVTCLGAGMKICDLPVVTRGQLDAIAAKAGELRVRMEQCQRLIGAQGGMGQMLKRIHEAADELSREELVAFSALQPLYALEIYHCHMAIAEDVDEARDVIMPHLRKSDRLQPVFKQALYEYWRSLWALGHLAVLATMDGAETLGLPPSFLATLGKTSFSWSAVRQGVFAIALRGAWSAARIGKLMLAPYKQFYQEATSFFRTIDGALGLAAIGLRHARLRAEALKALRCGSPVPEEDPRRSYNQKLRQTIAAVIDIGLQQRESEEASQRAFGADILAESARTLPRGAPHRYERAEDVPAELAMSASVCPMAPFVGNARMQIALFAFLPWVARASAEQLYLPRDLLRAHHAPWSPEMTLGVLRPLRDHYHAPGAIKRRPEGPTRSGPCPCGSGKKYKRCCGADAKGA